ncbi:hypothetical protein EV715DRAFT_210174 [Schizophyllum commune]
MPNELLAHILRHVPHGRPSPTSIFRLAHVCRRWRAVALEEPQLWTQLTLEDAQATGVDAVEQIHAWFSRAHPLSVSLTVRAPARDAPQRESAVHILDETILPLAPQISALDIDNTYARMVKFTRFPPCSFPKLVELHLKLPHDAHGSPLPSSVFSELGQLRSLSIDSLYSLTNQSLDVAMPIPWDHLQQMELFHIDSVHDFTEAFRRCKSLRWAVLHFSSWGRPQTPIDPVELLHLETLDVRSDCWPDALLSAVSLPSLKEFELHLGDQYHKQLDLSAWGDLQALAEQAPQLQSLTVRHVDLRGDEEQFASLLERLPNLERLEIAYFTMNPRCILPLFQYHHKLVPRLRVLHFHRISVGAFDMYQAGPIYSDAYEVLIHILEDRDFHDFTINWNIWDYKKMPLNRCEDAVRMLYDMVGDYVDGTMIYVEDIHSLYDRIRDREDGYGSDTGDFY